MLENQRQRPSGISFRTGEKAQKMIQAAVSMPTLDLAVSRFTLHPVYSALFEPPDAKCLRALMLFSSEPPDALQFYNTFPRCFFIRAVFRASARQ